MYTIFFFFDFVNFANVFVVCEGGGESRTTAGDRYHLAQATNKWGAVGHSDATTLPSSLPQSGAPVPHTVLCEQRLGPPIDPLRVVLGEFLSLFAVYELPSNADARGPNSRILLACMRKSLVGQVSPLG